MPLLSAGVARPPGMALQQPPAKNAYRRFKAWWTSMISLNQPGAADRARKVIYTAWNLWKERCRRVFDNVGMADNRRRCKQCSRAEYDVLVTAM
jgi:hypothetical protein